MFDLAKVKGIIFDYGGTIDSNGMHWAEVIWQAYENYNIPVTKEQFRDAYVYGERTLGKNPIVEPHHNFLEMLRIKTKLQFDRLVANNYLTYDLHNQQNSDKIAQWCYQYAQNAIRNTVDILTELQKKYPLVLVSNFYGNIQAVLKDFKIDHYFPVIIESAVVGIRKPDPAIFELGIKETGFPAENCVVIGDSYDKDIIPATQIGCQTIWLKSTGWLPYSGEEKADVIMEDFSLLRDIFRC